MSYKVLLVGNGAREHAIAKKIVENDGKLYSYMERENPGIADISKKFVLGDLSDFSKLDVFKKVDYAIIGPENPLANGISNYLEDKLNVPTCGPRKEVARIESSKIFTRCLMDAYDIPGNIPYTICSSIDDLANAIKEFGMEIAIKPDGLTGGKGVRVFGDHFTTFREAKDYARELLTKNNEFLVEEKKVGKEFSMQIFADGNSIVPMPLVRDYKRAYENEEGPNTGSMGSYSLSKHTLPYLTNSDKEYALDILRKTMFALEKQTGTKYRGILYGQFMKTDDSIYLIEFNVRFGDPEALNVLKLLDTDFNKLSMQITDGNLKTAEFSKLATVCTYLVPNGYPESPASAEEIQIEESEDIDLYFASVYRLKKSIRTTKSRSIALVGTGDELEDAREKIAENISKIKGNLFYRKDIGSLL
ncbi:MAG: phosphoribosylamine--glycine ligase [Asgard group archaeon]|nr:phosphoribosylamine--glycine ligase [Asgard group archaeon]